MAYKFNFNLCLSDSERRILKKQQMHMNRARQEAEDNQHSVMASLLDMTLNQDELTLNQGRTPADAYREFDSVSKIETNPNGEFSTWTRVIQNDKSVNMGRKIYEYRQVSDMEDVSQTTLYGQSGIKMDHTSVKYGGTVIPFHDTGYGRNFMEIEAMRADGYDALVDDAREAELVVMRRANSYMWNGDQSIVVDGYVWLGVKNDPTVVQTTYSVSLITGTGQEIRDTVRGLRDALTIGNDCSEMLDIAVSQEIMSSWEREYTDNTIGFGTILDWVMKLNNINSVYIDPELSGDEIAFFWFSDQGFHSVTKMAMGTFPEPRLRWNSDYNFAKVLGQGFNNKNTHSGKSCSLYATLV